MKAITLYKEWDGLQVTVGADGEACGQAWFSHTRPFKKNFPLYCQN